MNKLYPIQVSLDFAVERLAIKKHMLSGDLGDKSDCLIAVQSTVAEHSCSRQRIFQTPASL